MRTNVILSLMLAGAMAMTSCTRKVDEKTMADINQFGTDWMNLGQKATDWANNLSQTTQKTKDMTMKQKTMMDNMMNSKDEAMKAKGTECYNTCNANATKMEGMMTEWNSFKTQWDADTKSFSD